MEFKAEAFADVEPWKTEIEVFADGLLVFRGPITTITYAQNSIALTLPTPEYVKQISGWSV